MAKYIYTELTMFKTEFKKKTLLISSGNSGPFQKKKNLTQKQILTVIVHEAKYS